MSKRGKKYLQTAQLVDAARSYRPEEAIRLTKEAAHAAFDETVEIHMSMGLDPRHADQQLRGTAILPHGTGKRMRILVFAQGEAAKAAEEAEADYVGSDELIKKIEGGWVDFEVAIATPDMMGKIGKLGKVLGRRGLMPNPKSGTVVQPNDIGQVVANAKRGRIEFRLDKTAVVHAPLGKVSFDEKQLLDNLATFVDSILRSKPSGAKGTYVKSISVSSTQGPGIKLDPAETLSLKAE